jgi:hypothetical protein
LLVATSLVCLLASCDAFDTAPTPSSGDADAAAGDATASDAAGIDPRDADAIGTGEADAGGDVDAASEAGAIVGCHGALACKRVVFVTSVRRNGGFGGVAGADALCASEAASADAGAFVRGREFYAWVSVIGDSPSSRHPAGTEAYVRPDGTRVAANWAKLASGTLEAPINVDAMGDVVTGIAWTGTNADGSKANETCKDFASASASVVGTGGAVGAKDGTWTAAASYTCDRLGRVICVEY